MKASTAAPEDVPLLELLRQQAQQAIVRGNALVAVDLCKAREREIHRSLGKARAERTALEAHTFGVHGPLGTHADPHRAL